MRRSPRVPIVRVLDLPDRTLEAVELAEVARTVAAQESLWRPWARHNTGDRYYDSLHVDEHVGIWVICWLKGHDTGWHDHAGSHGAFAVAEGTVREERPMWVSGGKPRRVDATVGDALHFDSSEIHRMTCVVDEPVVTIHAYSVPLKRMGMYRIEPDGYLRRRDVSWDERLTATDAVLV